MSDFSKDTQLLRLDGQLRDLKLQRQKVRPAVYWLICLLGVLIGLLSFPSGVAFVAIFFGVAGLLSAVTTRSKGNRLDAEILEVSAKIQAIETGGAQPIT